MTDKQIDEALLDSTILLEVIADTIRNLRDQIHRNRTALERQRVSDAMDAVSNPRNVAEECDHQWVDARNEVIESGEWCPKCNSIRAAPGPGDDHA